MLWETMIWNFWQ